MIKQNISRSPSRKWACVLCRILHIYTHWSIHNHIYIIYIHTYNSYMFTWHKVVILTHKCMHPRRLAYFLRQVRLLIEVLELKGLGQTSVGPVIWPLKTGSKFAHIFCHIKYMLFVIFGAVNWTYPQFSIGFSPYSICYHLISYISMISYLSHPHSALSENSGWFASSSWILAGKSPNSMVGF